MAKRKKQWIWDDLPEPYRKIVGNIILYGIAIWLFIALFPTIWDLGFITTAGFLFSCALSLYRKVVLKDPRVIAIIAVGYILSNTAVSKLLPMIYEDLLKQSFLTAAMIGIVFLAIYFKAKEIKDSGTK